MGVVLNKDIDGNIGRIVTVDHTAGAGYIIRDRNKFHMMPIVDQWSAPACYVQIMSTDPILAAAEIMAWLGFPLIKNHKKRSNAFRALVAQWSHNYNNRRGIRGQLSDDLKGIRKRDRLTRIENTCSLALSCIRDVDIFLWRLEFAKCPSEKINYHGLGSVSAIARRLAIAGITGTTDSESIADHIRNRRWQKYRAVLHLADAIIQVGAPDPKLVKSGKIPEAGAELDAATTMEAEIRSEAETEIEAAAGIEFENSPETEASYVAGVLERALKPLMDGNEEALAQLLKNAEKSRRLILPTIGIGAAKTTQFRPGAPQK